MKHWTPKRKHRAERIAQLWIVRHHVPREIFDAGLYEDLTPRQARVIMGSAAQ